MVFNHLYNLGFGVREKTFLLLIFACFIIISHNVKGQCPDSSNFTEYFDGVSVPNIPACWSEIDNGNDDLLTATSSNNNSSVTVNPPSSPNVIEFNDGDITGGDTAMLISPSFSDLSTGDNRIRFEAMLECGSSEELLIGVMSDSSNSGTYVPYDTIKNSELSTSFQEFTVNLDDTSKIDSNDVHVALAHGVGACEILIDNFNYENIPSCGTPKNLKVENRYGDSAKVSWTSGDSGGSQWEVIYGQSGFNPSKGNNKVVSDTFTTLTNLMASTSYEFYVREICGPGDTSYKAGPGTFTTLCESVQAPLSENFDNLSVPDLPLCWSEIDNSGDLLSANSSNNNSSVTVNPPSSPNAVEFNDGDITSGDTAMLITPELSDLADSDNRIRFKAMLECGSSEELLIGVMSDSSKSGTYVPYDTIKNSELSTSFQEFIVDLNDTSKIDSNDIHVAFAHGDGSCEIYLDDFQYEEIPSCLKPSSLKVRNLYADSAKVSWTSGDSGGTQWKITYGQAGFNPSKGSSKVVKDTFSTLTGLTSNTEYEFYVSEVCKAGDTSKKEGPISFRTDCKSQPTPFKETFDSTTTPDCWENYGNEQWVFSTGASQGAASAGDHTGNNGNYAWVDGSSNNSSDTAVLESPSISLKNLDDPGIKFWVFSDNTNNPGDNNTLIVELYDGQNWRDSVIVYANDSSEWVKKFIDLDNYTINGDMKVRFIFHTTASSPSDNDLLIDDFKVIESKDLSLSDLFKPQSACSLSQKETVTGVALNSGLDTIYPNTKVELGYQVDKKSDTTVNYSINDTLPVGDTFHYQFNQKADLSKDGKTYQIKAWTNWSKDSFPENDTGYFNINNKNTPKPPQSVKGDTICPGSSATLSAKTASDTTSVQWFDSLSSNKPLSKKDTFKTRAINTADTFYVETAPVSPGLKITEINLRSSDTLEIQNLSNTSINANNWTVAIGDDVNNINDVHPDKWSLGKIPGDSVLYKHDNNWGSNIGWYQGDPGWVIIIDDQGNIIDFLAWGWSSSDIQNFNVTINGFNITINNQWTGAGATSCSNDNLLRTGKSDNNDASDFKCGLPRNCGSQNPGLNQSNWQSNSTTKGGCKSQRKPAYVRLKTGKKLKYQTSAPFEGSDSGGTKSNPDHACLGDTLTYEMESPENYSNADFGQEWTISNRDFLILSGGKPSDTSYKNPSAGQNAWFQIIIDSSTYGETLKLKTTIDFNGCTDTAVRFIKVSPRLDADFSVAEACNGDSVKFNNMTSFNGADSLLSYKWKMSDGARFTSPNPVHLFADTGEYSGRLKVSDPFGCVDSKVRKTKVNPLPKADFVTDSGCMGTPFSFTNKTQFSGSGISYFWRAEDKDSINQKDLQYQFDDTSGSIQVGLNAISDKGCVDSVTKPSIVYPTPVPNFIYINQCKGLDVEFKNQTSFRGASNRLSYGWQFGDGDSSNQENPVHAFNNQNNFDVTLKATDSVNQCADTTMQNVKVNPEPKADFSFTEECLGDSTAFNYTGDAGVSNYKWSINNNAFANIKNPKYLFDESGDFTVELLAIFNNGACSSSVNKTVPINPVPRAGFESSGNCVDESIQFNDTTSFSGDNTTLQYKWYFGNGDSSDQKEPSIQYDSAGQYPVTVKVTSGKGCQSKTQKTKTIYPLPNSSFDFKRTGVGTFKFMPEDSSYQSYKWAFGDDSTAEGTVVSHRYRENGSYTVQLSIETNKGCKAQSSKQVDVQSVGKAPEVARNSFKVYPNPFKKETTIWYRLQKAGKVEFLIHNSKGQKIAQKRLNHESSGRFSFLFEPEVKSSGNGVYFIRMIHDGEVRTKKVVDIQ